MEVEAVPGTAVCPSAVERETGDQGMKHRGCPSVERMHSGLEAKWLHTLQCY